MARTKKGQTAEGTVEKAGRMAIREFHGMLVLAQWARSFFQGEKFEVLQASLNRRELEGIDPETGHTKFFRRLTGEDLFNMNRVDLATFGVYDKNIVRHWQAITEQRNEDGAKLEMKYFQYLSLLVTELYLDWYFNHRKELVAELSARIADYNQNHARNPISPLVEDDLNKVSFWEATGAGKTLLLHVNIRQYLEYAAKAGKSPDRIIVLTPNEGLSRQHVEELKLSGFTTDLMRENDLFSASGAKTVSVVDSGKLISDTSTKKKGEKSFMAESFEGNNLVLVDEGHHGSSKEDGEHRKTRNLLCRDGFSFEYSATFGQAVAGKNAAALKALYAKSILFDYSYRFFYEDGYGKEAFILNMPEDDKDEQVFRYLCANLLSYYQQHLLYAIHPEAMSEFGIAKPLCVFVGNTVNTEESDIERIVGFFAEVLKRRADVEKLFTAFIQQQDVLMVKGSNPLKARFVPLMGRTGGEVYEDMLKRVFNADHAARLKVQYEKSFDEVTLSVNPQHPFCLINIGNAAEFVKKLEKDERFEVLVKEVSDSHCETINDEDSEISVLVGSRKFTEGWSSWRVSAMGLLNMGVNEGTQIIQLFGRGVRLRGRGFSLKRSTLAERNHFAPKCFLDYLETLQIFGIRANYMSQFKEYLEAEGVTTLDEVLTLDFPIKRNKYPKNLLVPQTKDGYRLNQKKGFKTQPITLFKPPEGLEKLAKKVVVKYDDYAYLQMMRTGKGSDAAEGAGKPEEVKLDPKGLAALDWDRVYRILLEDKGRNGYWNLAIEKELLVWFAQTKTDWYSLTARKEDVTFTSFANLANIERLFLILIRSYMDEYYKRFQSIYEDRHREMKPIDESWMPEEYHFEIQNTDIGKTWKQHLEELKALVGKEEIPLQEVNQWAAKVGGGFVVIAFPQHLYTPLFFQDKEDKTIPFTYRPISLEAKSERRFVKDLEQFYNSTEGKATFKDIDLYLMRNASNRLKGIGFAQAGNFYPDFMMWLVDKTTGRQYLTFIDPKGLRQIPFESPKLNFATEIKGLQEQIAKENDKIVLNSVILSDTSIAELTTLFGHSQEEYEAKNIFFLDSPTYLTKLFNAARQE